MDDIIMCKGYDCALKDKCYRHLAVSNSRDQLYFVRDPRSSANDHPKMCRYFEKIKGRRVSQPVTEGISL